MKKIKEKERKENHDLLKRIEEDRQLDENKLMGFNQKKDKILMKSSSSISTTIDNIIVGSFGSLFILILLIIPIRGSSECIYVAPWYIWLISIILSSISFLYLKGFSTKYSFDLGKQKLLKEYDLFSFHKEKEITDFKDIKLVGVSTIVLKNKDLDQKNSYGYEVISIYGNNNQLVVIEKDLLYDDNYSIKEINKKVQNITEHLKCSFIPCDGISKIVMNNSNYNGNDIKSLITFIPNEK